MLDLEKLRIFYYVARELNIGRAAEALRLNTASVSKHIKLLEAHLNKKLIKRKRYGVALTENGESFFAQIASNVANLDNILTTHDFSEKKEKKELWPKAKKAINFCGTPEKSKSFFPSPVKKIEKEPVSS